MALEYSKPATLARARPTTPYSAGPILLVAADETSWHCSHLPEMVLPWATSALASTVPQSGRASSVGAEAAPPAGVSTTPSTT